MAEPQDQTPPPSSPPPAADGPPQLTEPQSPPPPPPPPPPSSPPPAAAASPPQQPLPMPPPSFDPSRMIGIIKRKALITELAVVYHAECLAYCQELLELQKNYEEPFVDVKVLDDSRKDTLRPQPKRQKKTR